MVMVMVLKEKEEEEEELRGETQDDGLDEKEAPDLIVTAMTMLVLTPTKCSHPNLLQRQAPCLWRRPRQPVGTGPHGHPSPPGRPDWG